MDDFLYTILAYMPTNAGLSIFLIFIIPAIVAFLVFNKSPRPVLIASVLVSLFFSWIGFFSIFVFLYATRIAYDKKADNKDSAIFTRRSIRKYDSRKPATVEQINDILDAGMHAPTAMGKEPWEFLVVTSKEAISKIMANHPYCSCIEDAGTAILVCGNTDVGFKIPEGSYYQYDCSAVAENIMLRAKELGLGSCWFGVEPDRAIMNALARAFNLPKNISPVALITIGTPNEDPKLEKPRFVESKVHREEW